MGGAPSTMDPAQSLSKNAQDIVKLMYPLYFTTQNITKDEHKIASDSWNHILNDTAPEFLARRGKPDFPYSSSIIFFYDTFYMRLFNVHPMSRNLFKNGMRSQGKFLVKMITLALSEISDSAKFDKTLVKLAEVHNQRGVKCVEYGVVGEVLFWVLKKVMGADSYDSRVHLSWVKVYSRMLRVIVPTALALELQTNSEWQGKRLTISQESYMFSDSNQNSTSQSASRDGERSADETQQLESEKIRRAEATNA